MIKSNILVVGSTGTLGESLNPSLEKVFNVKYCKRLDINNTDLSAGKIKCNHTNEIFDLTQFDVIINCAWVSGISRQSLYDNIKISQKLLQSSGKGLYIYFSSVDVYGRASIDKEVCLPVTNFALNKLRVEKFIAKYSFTERKKLILRIGNYIPEIQLSNDIRSNVFIKNVNKSKPAYLVSPDSIVNQIIEHIAETATSAQLLIKDCFDKPNLTWGQYMDKDYNAEVQPINVTVLPSVGFIPYLLFYPKKNGAVSFTFIGLKPKVFLIDLLSRFISQKPGGAKITKPLVSVNRTYQDYTLR